MRCVGAKVGFALRYSASIAAVTMNCLDEEQESGVTKCRDIMIAPLPKN